VGLVEFEARPVLELLAELAFPLRAGDRVEAAILQALHALVAQRGLHAVEFPDGLLVHSLEAFFGRQGHARHSINNRLPLLSRLKRSTATIGRVATERRSESGCRRRGAEPAA
jgi:hypothetical protein